MTTPAPETPDEPEPLLLRIVDYRPCLFCRRWFFWVLSDRGTLCDECFAARQSDETLIFLSEIFHKRGCTGR